MIPIDSIFSPIQRVNVRVENARVGRQTDYDRLIIEVWTDDIKPDEAVYNAEILKDHLIFLQTVIPRKRTKETDDVRQ